MNTKLGILLALLSLNASAETFLVPASAVTSNLRIVTNHVFNPPKSIYWKPFKGECRQFLTNGIVLQEVKVIRTYEPAPARDARSMGTYNGFTPARRLLSEQRVSGKKFLLRNCPASLQATTGKEITGLAMQTGTIQIGQDVLEVWDCGRIPSAP